MKKSIVLIVVGLGLAAALAYFSRSTELGPRQREAVGTSTPSVSETNSTKRYDASIDLSSIKNLQEAEKALSDHAESLRIYKLVWDDIVEVDTADGPFYFGELYTQYGDGTPERQGPRPLFLAKGVLYSPAAYGGNGYALAETDWVFRFKDFSIDTFSPAESMFSMGYDPEIQATARLNSGMQEISASLDKEGNLTHLVLTMGENILSFDGPFKKVAPVDLVVKDKFAGQPDYNAYAESWRNPAGIVTGRAEYKPNTGFVISYPEKFNGIRVKPINVSQYYDTFNVSDDPNSENDASINCYPMYPEEQEIGPKTGDIAFIATSSRKSVFDWGYRKEYHSEVYSFTGGGFHCEFRTAEGFRPEMFSISLP